MSEERDGHVNVRARDGCSACKHIFNLTLVSWFGLGLCWLEGLFGPPPPTTITTTNISIRFTY